MVPSSYSKSFLLAPLLLLVILVLPTPSLAFSTGAGTTDSTTITSSSPWSPSAWTININFGRESSTDLPPEWGESGARLVLPVPVTVRSDAMPSNDMDAVIGNGAMIIEPTNEPSSTYINSRGEQKVQINGGGWKIDLPQGSKGYASTLKMHLDLCTELERNDVTVSADRLYLFAPCWREGEYQRGKMAMEPIVAAAKEAQRVLDEQLSHEDGDRRLDGTDPIDTVLAYKDMAKLVADRDERKRRRREAEKIYPRDDDEAIMGAWPGTTEPMAIGSGAVLLKRKKLLGYELFTVGRWGAVPAQGTTCQ
eukprot:CAMPEP_0178545830 /NCGR_PEP_ID=MMETSP0697-20121206/3845_1 /TAXON_ID=265572 /ORGANISM="Extubocellulus spinifer, Strain CCMP396" /LENGTH=307 /DNA_ID=CAMNT_0020178411 /DNA_START=97 /DNA_END=1020 /DNA_ORIENTATION=+